MTQTEHVGGLTRLGVAGDVISDGNVDTVDGSAVLNIEAASFSSLRETQDQPFS